MGVLEQNQFLVELDQLTVFQGENHGHIASLDTLLKDPQRSDISGFNVMKRGK